MAPHAGGMRVDPNPPPLQTTPTRRDARAEEGGSNFADIVSNEKQASPASASAAPVSIEGLFLLQEVAEEMTGRRRAAARANSLLDRLEDLRLALISGKLPVTQLQQLRHLAREHGPLVDDPKLTEILGEIELRVAVELAKLDQFG